MRQYPDSSYEGGSRPGRAASQIVYAIYAVSLFSGFPMFVGVIIAYLARGDADALHRSHLTWLITTFWWTLVIGILGWLLTFILIGFAVLGLLWLWTAYRVIRGWMRLWDNRPAPGWD